MIGARVERVARRLLREDTYRLMAAPAIADLQFERSRGRLTRTHAYVAVWRAIAGAFTDELQTDALSALTALAAPAAVRHGAWTLVATTLATLFPILFLTPRSHASPVVALLMMPSVVVGALLPALALGTREAARHRRSTRAFVLAGFAIAAVVFVSLDQGVTRASRALREYDAGVRGVEHVRRGANEMPVSELLRVGAEIASRNGVGHRNEFVRAPHARAAMATACVAYVLFGVALAGVRLRVAIPIVLAICISHFLLIGSTLVASAYLPRLLGAVAWMPTVALLAAAALSARLRTQPAQAADPTPGT